jgi:hypothetical protein
LRIVRSVRVGWPGGLPAFVQTSKAPFALTGGKPLKIIFTTSSAYGDRFQIAFFLLLDDNYSHVYLHM